MKDKLIDICHKRLSIADDCIDNYEAYKISSGIDMFSPIPTNHLECSYIGDLLKEIGSAINDYELIGIGQTFITKSEELFKEEIKFDDVD